LNTVFYYTTFFDKTTKLHLFSLGWGNSNDIRGVDSLMERYNELYLTAGSRQGRITAHNQ